MYLRNWKRSRRSGCKELPQVMLRQFLRGRGDVRILISFFFTGRHIRKEEEKCSRAIQ